MWSGGFRVGIFASRQYFCCLAASIWHASAGFWLSSAWVRGPNKSRDLSIVSPCADSL